MENEYKNFPFFSSSSSVIVVVVLNTNDAHPRVLISQSINFKMTSISLSLILLFISKTKNKKCRN